MLSYSTGLSSVMSLGQAVNVKCPHEMTAIMNQANAILRNMTTLTFLSHPKVQPAFCLYDNVTV